MPKILYILLIFTSLLQAQTKLQPNEAFALKSKVKTKAASTSTISSTFIQYKHLDFLSNDIVSNGKLTFKSPNKIKWEYVDPFNYIVIFNDQTLHINDNGTKSEVNIGSSTLFKQLNQLIVKSIKGDMFDDDAFDISYFKHGESIEVHFKVKDKNQLEYIEAFHLLFNAEGDVEEVKMIEQSKDYTRIVFKDRVLNKPVTDAFFSH